MRIGEVLAARRRDLVLPCDSAPGTSFMLVVVHQPKTRGRSANHQAARIDQEDVVRFLTSVYKDAAQETPVAFFSGNSAKKIFTAPSRAGIADSQNWQESPL
eukprot:s675_g40.t1